jgi:hypothetical protein
MRFLLGLLTVLALTGQVTAGELLVTIPLDPASVRLDHAGLYTAVTYPGATILNGEGLPSLPVLPVTVALPVGTLATGLSIVEATYSPVFGRHVIMPNGPAVPLSFDEPIEPIAPDMHVYGRDVSYPFETVELKGSGPMLGIPVADLNVYPVRWNPADGQIEILSSLIVSIETAATPEACTILRRSAQSEQRSMDIVRAIAVNPEGVSGSGAMIVDSRDLQYGEYVIITHPDYAAAMQELADWKTAKGVPTNIYTTTWIQSQYTAYDLQQEMRAFLIDCRNQGVEYVLIVGDDDKVAARDVQLSSGGESSLAPCDLYFADNNDTAPAADRWDSSGNHIWGEYGVDLMDYHPDFLVGRAPVRSVADAALFNDKVFLYEHVGVSSTDYFETAPEEMRIGYSTGYLWDDGGVPVYGSALAYLVGAYFPAAWEQEGCHEEVAPGNSGAITTAMINAGPHHVMHSSHGAEELMYTSYGNNWTTSDIMALTNMSGTGTIAIWNSISCLIGAFDTQTCCGDAWVRSPNGGGFGAFNSRYGWGMLGVEPGTGLSNDIVKQFYVEYMQNGIYGLGAAHATSVDQFMPPDDDCWHWCTMEYNLLGDPEVSMWTLQASDLTVSHPASVSGTGSITVTVNGGSGPLANARVCLQKGNWQTGEVYAVGTTNSSGQVTLYAAPATTGSIVVTVWAHNCNPYQGSITVTGVGIEGPEGSVAVTSLGSIAPSPAYSSASIGVIMGTAGHATLTVFDMAGRIVAELANTELSSGEHSIVWDLTDDNGSRVPSGIYTVRLDTPDYSSAENLVVLR